MWHKVAKVSDMADGGAQTLQIDQQPIALFKLGGLFYAIQNACLHRGGPLADGHLEGTVVTCPWHGWEFDVKSGECRTMEGAKLKTYPTKIENEDVFIQL